MEAVTNTTITCKNCKNTFTGKYCNACGEKVYGKHDKSVAHIFEEALHFITHFEGNFLTTVKTIFLKPGKLSYDYCNGVRKKYYKPVTLFFFLIVIYLFFPSVFPKGLDMELKYHQGQRFYSAYVQNAIDAKMLLRRITYDELSQRFSHQSHVVSKFMLFSILPLCAFVLMALYPRGKQFFDHFMLSTEVNAFFLTAFFMLMPLLFWAVAYIAILLGGHVPEGLGQDEGGIMLLISVLFLIFCIIAFRRFYGSSYLVSTLKAIVFIIFQYIIVYVVYKFLLFTVVMMLL